MLALLPGVAWARSRWLLGCGSVVAEAAVSTRLCFAARIFADPAALLAGRALRHHDAACFRPGPGQTGKVTPVSSSETAHRRRWMAVSRDCRLDRASFG
jgi:hypothetical protein